jgi:hypothetical protein
VTTRNRTAPGDAASDPPPFHWWDLAPALLARLVTAAREDTDGSEPDETQTQAEALAARAVERFTALVQEAEDPLAQIAAACELDGTEAAVLAVVAACEIDPDVLRIATARSLRQLSRPTVSVLLEIFGADGVRAVAAGGRLDRAGLIETETTAALLAAAVAVPRPVLWRLLDEPPDPAQQPPGVELLACPPHLVGTRSRVLVHGTDPVRRRQAAVTTTAGLLFYVGPPPSDEADWRALTRDASLAGAGIVLELTGPPEPPVLRWIATCDHLSWALATAEPVDLALLGGEQWYEVAAAEPAVRPEEWAAVFPDAEVPGRLPSASLLRAAEVLRPAGASAAEALRRAASGTLLKHARRVVPTVGWDELILPPAQEQRLRDLVDRYRCRGRVHDEWGLPLYPSPGVVALFSGPSGTGKTTTAEVIAHDLGVDLFRVDLSALVSKYIGETEKNLEEIFSAAHAGDYLLLFDEADSLFGSRSKVSDARDRYANMEVSYLLQRLESYDGFVVLTSNFQGNIDQAFLRRIHVTVHFPVPNAADRERIWDRCLGKAPRENVELDFVAGKFELSGGSIRNAALTAAFLAAARDEPVRMVHVLQAIGQEMTKLGQRPTSEQFGRWAGQLESAGG